MRLLRSLVSLYLRRADRIVAIGDTMRQRLEEKGARRPRARDPELGRHARLEPQERANRWAASAALHEKFVVMHSATSATRRISTRSCARDVPARSRRPRDPRHRHGARHAELVTLAEQLEVDHVHFLYYQSRRVLAQSLSSADVHVVGLAPGLAGYVVPSRLYGILAVARPVIVAADAESETAQVVQRIGCGIVVPPGRPELLARAIRDAHDGKYDLVEMGRRGREWVEREADRSVAVGRYRDLLGELAPS
jgi:hypothetical protein